jgi:hypothetical protein
MSSTRAMRIERLVELGREVGVNREHGLLDGHWVDIVLMERLL